MMCMDKIIKHKNAYIDAFKKGVTGVENNVLYPNVDSTSPYYTELNEEQEISSFAYEVGKTLKGNIGGSGGGDNSGTTIPNHNHDDRYAKIVHDHDGRYYTKIQIDEWRDRLINGDLLFNKINSNHIQAGTIVAGSTIIANGAIGNAQISKVSADKLDAGVVDTSKVTISGANGNLKLRGNRLQVFEGIGTSQFERVSLGDVNDDGTVYGLRVRGADGQTILYDENGVYREGITDGSINNDKIAGDANIDGGKLNIHSVITNINENNTGTIHGTKIDIDGESVTSKIFNIELNQDEQFETIERQQAEINQNKEQIELKVSNQKYTEDMASMTSKLEKAESDIEILNEGIKLTASKTEVQNQINKVKDFVSSEIGDLSVGGANYLNNSAPRKATVDELITWDRTLNGTRRLTYWQDYNDSVENPEIGYHPHIDLETFHFPCIALINRNAKFSMANRELSLRHEINKAEEVIIPNETYVISFDAYSDTSLFSFHGGLYHKNVESNNYNYHSGRMSITISQENVGIWQRYSFTFDTHKGIDTSKPIYLVINGHNNPEGSGYIKNIKLERSNIVSQWVPSQFDVDDSLDDVVNDMKEYTNKSISEYNTNLDIRFDGINQSVSKIDKTVNGVKNDLSNLEIGARNLVKNSAFIDGKNNWILGTNVIIDTTKTFNGHPSCKSSQKGLASSGYRGCENYNLPNKNCLSMKKGETYTVSCWYYVEDRNTFNGALALECKGKFDNNTSNSTIMRVSFDKNTMVEGQWTKMFKTITVDKDYRDVCVRAWVGRDGTAWFTDFKLEKGNKSTDWSPAPDDMKDYVDETITNQNASIDIKFNKITSRVEATEQTVDGVNQKYTELKQTVDGFNFTGLVRFDDLSKLGGTVINGGNIDTTNLRVRGELISGQINGVGGIKFADGAIISSYDSHVPGYKGIRISAPSIKLGDKVDIHSAIMYGDVVGKNNTSSATTTWSMSGNGALTCASANLSGALNVRNGAIYGMNNLALARGSVYVPIFETNITCDYIRGGNSSIAFTDTGPIHFIYNGLRSSFIAGGVIFLPHGGNVNCDHFRLGAGIMASPSSGSFHFLTASGNTSPLYAGILYSATRMSLDEPMVVSSNPVFDKINSIDVIETKDGLRLYNPIQTTKAIDKSTEVVKTEYDEDKNEINTSIDYTSAISTLWKAVQELKQENEELKKLIKGEI
nr:MAG TPA: Putative tail protein [Caudoviricetes sp.]